MRIQWDPERDLRFRPLPHRSIQIGLSGETVTRYCDRWVLGITDVTDLAHEVHRTLRADGETAAAALLPAERPYSVPEPVASRIGSWRSEIAASR